jgi:tRNA1Val (adenine37-N6)-methyltransferase
MTVSEKQTLRIDDTGFGGIRIIQDPDAFCYGVDAVLLAAFAAERINKKRGAADKKLMDLGCGNGIIPLILSHKTEIQDIRGIELQKSIFDLALENIRYNCLEERLSFYNYDIAELLDSDAGRRFESAFDFVTANPPYTASVSGMTGDNTAKMKARHETTADLESFLGFSVQILKPKGELFMVHRPSRLVDIFSAGRRLGLETKEIQLVSGHAGENPNIVLLKMVRGAGRELKVLPQIFVRNEDGSYSETINNIYERNRK